MIKLLHLPKNTDPNISKSDLIDLFFGTNFTIAAIYEYRFQDVQKQILESIEDVEYSPETYWRALWLATLLSLENGDVFHTIRSEIQLELNDLDNMDPEEFDDVMALLASSMQDLYDFPFLFYIQRLIMELDAQSIGDDMHKVCKKKVYALVKEFSDQFHPRLPYLSLNKYCNSAKMAIVICEIAHAYLYKGMDTVREEVEERMTAWFRWDENGNSIQDRIVDRLISIIKESDRLYKTEATMHGSGKNKTKKKKKKK